MHAAINALCLGNRSGTGRYTEGLINGFVELADREVRLSVFIPSHFPISPKWWRTTQVRFYSIPIPTAWHRVVWEQWFSQGWLKKLKPDLLHSPAFVVPLFRRGPYRQIITIHDLAFLRFPQTLPAGRRRYLAIAATRSMRLADAIITDSRAIQREVQEQVNRPEKVAAVPLGVNPALFHTHPTLEDEKILESLGVQRPYFLFAGTIEPRKNLSRILSAYLQARREGVKPNLVIAGRLGWKHDTIPLYQEGVVGVGFVTDAKLAALYRHAESLLAPSLYEGFDLPVVEAAACGTPVICSDIPVHHELFGEEGRYISVEDEEGWKKAFISPDNWNPSSRAGEIRGWTDAARDLLECYRRVIVSD